MMTLAFYVGPSRTRYDSVRFAYMRNGKQMFTDRMCGCMHDLSHFSCDVNTYEEFNGSFYFANSADDLTGILLGTDLKFILSTDFANKGGKVSVKWQCIPTTLPMTTSMVTSIASVAVTDTREMAAALMTGSFPLDMATDYGCAGRGSFDPFSTTIGRPVDDIDRAFFPNLERLFTVN